MITSNSIGKQQANPSNDVNLFAAGANLTQATMKSKLGGHQRNYSFEQKSKIYGQKFPSYQTHVPQGQGLLPTNTSDSRNQTKFGSVATTGITGQQASINSAMSNSSFKHQQRKLSYSPVLTQSTQGVKNKKDSDTLAKLVHRRAHSKTDKYPNEGDTSAIFGQDDSVDTKQQFQLKTQQNFLIQNSIDKQLPQRFSPLQYATTNGQQLSKNKRTDSRDNSLKNTGQQPHSLSRGANRPTSASSKQKEGHYGQANFRQILQQNANFNKENQKLIQQKLGYSGAKKSAKLNGLSGITGLKDDFLKGLLNNQAKQANITSSYFMSNLNNSNKPNSRQNANGHRPTESFDIASRNNIDSAIQAYKTSAKTSQSSTSQHKRSQSFQNSANKQQQISNLSQAYSSKRNQELDEDSVSKRANSRHSQKRPKSNNDMIKDKPDAQATKNLIGMNMQKGAQNPQQPVMRQSNQNFKTTQPSHNASMVEDPSNIHNNVSASDAPQQQRSYTFASGNPQQMSTNCVTKFAFATKTGMAPSNPNKVNQDNWITVPHFSGLKYCHFFSVCDGHGQYGREVSTFLKTRLPQYLEHELRYVIMKYQEQNTNAQKDEPLNTDEICIAFNNAFLDCNEELFSGIMDIRFSGSTCVSLITLGQKLFCSNVGDSRAIVVKKLPDGKMLAQAISRDQKPCQQDEAERIIACGGRIDSFRDHEKNPIGPLRVWLKVEDIPGLAMTRSFGDEVASRVGVMAEPEILELDLGKDDKFLVLASDGVWEFLQNEDIAKIVMPFYEQKNAEGAAEAVVRESYLRWRQEEEDIVDDITCVIVFLDVKLPQQAPTENSQQ